ncbi:sterol desaturase family protein [Saccharibacter floricola]|uniref:sterol desaturase family protein n=1 Tax=Saccharibacter floricola TaxID=231053 RepID=UPI00039A4C33|nr:sterol desaturase family protein [Saccharibacter floricola]
MKKNLSRLIRISDPNQPNAPHCKVSGEAEPVRIFQHDWMESFTFISFRTFLISCLIVEMLALTTAIVYAPSTWAILWRIAIGVPAWVLTEYLLHRYVFHFSSNIKAIQHLVYIFHGNHHIQPSHPYRTLMPLIVTLPIGAAIWGVSVWCTDIGLGSAFFAGFFLGYTLYDTLHFATHNFPMKSAPWSWWKRHHLLHHYMAEEHNYSITMPWLDALFRTHYTPKRKQKPTHTNMP